MKSSRLLSSLVLGSSFLALLSISSAFSQEKKVPTSPTEPIYQNAHWVPARNAAVKKALLEKPCDILFVGDSITEQWEFVGKKPWEEIFVPLKAVNFGVSGDRTEHVLWRFEDTKLATVTPPKVCVLMIGTNNIGTWGAAQSAKETTAGVEKIARTLLDKFPKTHLIIMDMPPYDASPESENRKLGVALNKEVKKLKLPRTSFLSINRLLLERDGTHKKDLFVDKVHFTPATYDLWAKALLPKIKPYL